MPRKPRLEITGALYHVIVRGNQRRYVFLDDYDYVDYLDNLLHYHTKVDHVLYAYVLMRNHVHLLVEQGNVPLQKVMQRIHLRFTQRFNRRHGKCGHVFQGRYKAIMCQHEKYFTALLRYLHLNPCRAGVVADPGKYPWSSHASYLTGRGPEWLEFERGLSLLADNRKSAIARYRQLIADDKNDGILPDSLLDGDYQYYANLRCRQKMETADGRADYVALDRIVDEVCGAQGIAVATLFGGSRNRTVTAARRAVIIRASTESGQSQAALARYLGCCDAYVSRVLLASLADAKNRSSLTSIPGKGA